MSNSGGQFRRPNSGWWEAQLHLTEELGNCRMKVNGLTVWTVTSQLVPKSTRTLVNSYLFLVNSYLSQLVPKSTRTKVFLYLLRTI